MINVTTADVLVVGLGAFGSATVYQLAKRGVDVIGIDQFTPPHDRGSSHGATRISRVAVGEGEVYVPIIKRSHAIWEELEQNTGRKLFHRTGGLIMGPADADAARHHGKTGFIKQTIDNACRFDIPHDVLDAAEITRRYPQFLLNGHEIAYFEPGSGVLVPEACVETQLEEAKRLGATLHFDEKVLSIEESAGVVEVRTTRFRYSAAKVIITAGPWVPGMAGGAIEANTDVRRQTLHWFATDEPDLWRPERCPIFVWMHGSGDADYLYGFPLVDGINGVKVASEQYRTTCAPDDLQRAVAPAESARLYDEHVNGRLRGIQRDTVHAAACLYTVSTDSNFIVDAYRNMDSVQVVSACSGHGFKNSAGLGERLALHAMDSRSAFTRDNPALAAFAMTRFG